MQIILEGASPEYGRAYSSVNDAIRFARLWFDKLTMNGLFKPFVLSSSKDGGLLVHTTLIHKSYNAALSDAAAQFAVSDAGSHLVR